MYNMTNNFLYFLLLCIVIIFIFLQSRTIENYVDPYSIDLHADAINRMKRWNMFHSRKYSSLNKFLYSPINKQCYYSEY